MWDTFTQVAAFIVLAEAALALLVVLWFLFADREDLREWNDGEPVKFDAANDERPR